MVIIIQENSQECKLMKVQQDGECDDMKPKLCTNNICVLSQQFMTVSTHAKILTDLVSL